MERLKSSLFFMVLGFLLTKDNRKALPNCLKIVSLHVEDEELTEAIDF
jgi:hypothetical protein